MSDKRKKSLLIGINYVGSSQELKGCHSDVDNMAEFLSYRGYDNSRHNRVILSDRPEVPQDSPYFPTGHNLLAAMDWLVSEPGCTLFMHYSGHGGLIADVDGNRGVGGMDNTLGVIVGADPIPRSEVISRVWSYIRDNKLQDPKDGRQINADDKLKAVFGGKAQVSMFEMTKLISNHLK